MLILFFLSAAVGLNSIFAAVAQLGKNTDIAAELLLNGGIVAIPTETVYGLAANALDEKAVLKIFEAKNRPFFDPLIIHVHSLDAVSQYALLEDRRLLQLAKKFWPGPLTLLLPKKKLIPAIVTSGLPDVAVRIPKHALTLELLAKLNLPLAAPSANPFGYVSPTQAAHVNKQLGENVDYILDGGPSSIGLESSILGIENDKLCLYRLGGLSVEDIEKVAGPVELRINHSSNPVAPGQLKSHYAPKKPMLIGDPLLLLKKYAAKKIALICFGKKKFEHNGEVLLFNLSEKEDMQEAAINLFNFLRLADDSDAELVICEKVPELGLGRAINDRLQRAATK